MSRGKDEVYVASFPIPTKGSGRFQTAVVISHAGATTERNSCTSPDGKLMSVEVVLSPSFKASAPKFLFAPPIYAKGTPDRHLWDISPDGQKFLINTVSSDQSSPIAVVLNWQAALKK